MWLQEGPRLSSLRDDLDLSIDDLSEIVGICRHSVTVFLIKFNSPLAPWKILVTDGLDSASCTFICLFILPSELLQQQLGTHPIP